MLKWYGFGRPEDPVPDEVRALTRRARDEPHGSESSARRRAGLRDAPPLGTEGFHFLLVSTWRNANELWETTFYKDDDADPGFLPWVVEGVHRPTFCVWELGVVAHERLAWAGYFDSGRDAAARRTYLGDTFEGPV